MGILLLTKDWGDKSMGFLKKLMNFLTSTSNSSEPYTENERKDVNLPTAVTTPNPAVIIAKYRRAKSYWECSRFFQRFDDNYDCVLGYEWFLVCIGCVKFPRYNSISQRLYNLRHASNETQASVAKHVGISSQTLSSYENGYTEPSGNILNSLSRFYSVPLNFIEKGYTDNLKEHIRLCYRYGEHDYMDSLIISVRAANIYFVDMLSVDDREICVLVNNEFNLNIDLFGEKAKAEKELRDKIKSEILTRLRETDLKQSDLYKSLEEHRNMATSIVKELANNGIIAKEKQGNTYILSLIKE